MSDRNNKEAITPAVHWNSLSTHSDHWSLPCPSHVNHITMTFLRCHLSHKTACHPWLESWYNKPEWPNSSQNLLLRWRTTSVKLELCKHFQQWGSLHRGIIKHLQTGANQLCSYESWKYSIVTSRNFWQLSQLNSFLTIDLSCTEISSSLCPGLTHFLNPCDRWILTLKLAPVICLYNRSKLWCLCSL